MTHDNGLPKRERRLAARARHYAVQGYVVASINAAGYGDRPRSAADDQGPHRTPPSKASRRAVDEIFESLVGPLVENTVPEWQTTLDALLALPEIDGPVGYSS